MIFSGKRSFSNLFNDYNVKFLPKTQLIDLNLKRKKTNFNKKDNSKFFIEIYNDRVIVANVFGEFYETYIDDITDEKKIIFKKLNTENLFKVKGSLLDILIVDEKIYVSKISEYNNCTKLEIYFADINKKLNFEIFKSFDECESIKIGAGRITNYNFMGAEGILITTNDSDNDEPGNKAQNDKSVFGKIVFIEKKTRKHQIISKGHRNAQGIFVKEDVILSSEHGPKGGDELNKIIFGKNYGWPIASYGQPYFNKELKYLESHKDNDFEEPLLVFMPSIGISEIIILPNSFDSNWKNNVLATSLNGRSIYRIKFSDDKFDKILYFEKIYIGERIRDIKYFDKFNIILLALERTGDIGILYK